MPIVFRNEPLLRSLFSICSLDADLTFAVEFRSLRHITRKQESFGAISRVLMKLETEHDHWRS
jgi:hypothetical protein